jgi:hypothetical protein
MNFQYMNVMMDTILLKFDDYARFRIVIYVVAW